MYSVLCIYTRLETIQRLNLHYNTLHWRWTKPHQLSDSAKYPTWLLCHQGPLSQSKHLLVLPGTLTCDDKKITNLPESLEIELLLPLLGMTLHCQRLFVSWLRGVLICSVISTYENLGEGLRHTALPCGASQAKYEVWKHGCRHLHEGLHSRTQVCSLIFPGALHVAVLWSL